MSLASLADILEILKHRRTHCHGLLELARRQKQVIDASDYSQLMALLAQKQRLLGRLDEINRRHPDLGRRWEQLRGQGSSPSRSDCEAVISETESILAEILQTEKEGTERLGRRRDDARRQLESIAHGVHVNETYRDNVAPLNHRFLDLNR